MRFHRPAPSSGRPTVSVVVPCYNYGRYLPDAVASALDQRDIDVDVLVVDDASTDDSAEVAHRLAAADPRVSVLVHARNTGHIRTYNDGLARARGDYVALLSADDLLARDALTRAAALLEHHPRTGLVYGYARSFTGGPDTSSTRVRSWSVYPGRQWLGITARRGRCFISSPEVLMRRAAMPPTDPYDSRLPHSGDFDLWMRTALGWDIGRVNGPVQAHYRVHGASMHLTTYAGWRTDLIERRRTFELLTDEHAPGVAWVQDLRPVAARALAREAVRRAGAAERDGDPAEAAALVAFAVTTDPAVRRPTAHRRTPGWSPAARGLERVAHHLRWRRERRYGT